MTFEEFMRLFHGAVAAVENGEVAEIDLDYDEEESAEVHITIRRKPYRIES